MPVRIEKLSGAAFLAFPDMLSLLQQELAGRFACTARADAQYGDLLYFADWNPSDNSGKAAQVPYWCRTAMLEPQLVHFDSIGEAAAYLKSLQRNWAPYQYQLFRRAALIQDKLPYINLKKRNFPLQIPDSSMGLYTLIDSTSMIISAKTTSPLPAGLLTFNEDHTNPPSRAYLKLQESLSLAARYFSVPLPAAGQRCFDAGACPGGWTWVLTKLRCSVFAVARAELAPDLMSNPNVTFRTHDAFTLPPEELGAFDWVFSDVICYPSRLYEWVQTWLASGLVKNMICTIKMQGAVDWDMVQRFADIPDSRVVHLCYNKHELTWIHCSK